MKFTDRIKHSWNAFLNRDPTYNYRDLGGPSYGYRPDRMRFTRGNERSIVTSVYNRIALDAASIDIMHVQLDKDDRFESVRDSALNPNFSYICLALGEIPGTSKVTCSIFVFLA